MRFRSSLSAAATTEPRTSKPSLTTSAAKRPTMIRSRPVTISPPPPRSPSSARPRHRHPRARRHALGDWSASAARVPDPKRATFNARADNLAASTLWRRPLHKHRCLVPLSGYYEWRKSDKQAFRFVIDRQPLYALAGLWDAWKSPAGDWLQSFSIITVEANETMRPIHDRMPAILAPRDWDEWLDRGEVERPPTHLLRPWADTSLHTRHSQP